MSEPKRTAFEAARRWSDANHWWGEGKAEDGVPASTVARALIDGNGLVVASTSTSGVDLTVNSMLITTNFPTEDPGDGFSVWLDTADRTLKVSGS